MTTGGQHHSRNNKAYGWLKRKHSEACSKNQQGMKNSQYGKKWFFDPTTLESKSMFPEEVLEGWLTGRILNKEKYVKGVRQKNKRRKSCDITEKKAIRLYNRFIENNYASISAFIKDGNWDKSHEALRQLWVKYVPEYKKLASQGIPFLKSASKVFKDTRKSSKL